MINSSLPKLLRLRKGSCNCNNAQFVTVTATPTPTPTVTVAVTASPLSIELLPEKLQWWDEERYWLIHRDTGLRVPGSWSIQEALEIQKLSRDWDWTVDPKSRIPNCQHEILNLCVRICDRKTTQGNQKRLPNQQESASFCNSTEVN